MCFTGNLGRIWIPGTSASPARLYAMRECFFKMLKGGAWSKSMKLQTHPLEVFFERIESGMVLLQYNEVRSPLAARCASPVQPCSPISGTKKTVPRFSCL